MPASLIRSRAMITHALDRHHWNEVTDGAVFQEDGVIAEIGSFAQLSRKHPDASVIGTGNNLVAESFTFTDARASSRWCSLVAPTIGAVMTGLASNHATARADYRLSIVPSNRGPV